MTLNQFGLDLGTLGIESQDLRLDFWNDIFQKAFGTLPTHLVDWVRLEIALNPFLVEFGVRNQNGKGFLSWAFVALGGHYVLKTAVDGYENPKGRPRT